MSKDKLYEDVPKLIERGIIEKLSDLFKYASKSRVAIDLGKNTGRTYIFFDSPDYLTYRDINNLAQLLGVDKLSVIDLIDKQIEANMKENGDKAKLKSNQ